MRDATVCAALYLGVDAPKKATATNRSIWESMVLFVTFNTWSISAMRSQALKIFQAQHRTCVFSIAVCDSRAYVFRWDRSGAVGAGLIDYVKEPEKICNFLLAFSNASAETQGYDTTVMLVSPGSAEFQLMDEMASDHQQSDVCDETRLSFRNSVKAGNKRWRLSVVDTSQQPERRMDLLVGAPHYQSASIAGLGTRTFIALKYDLSDDGDIIPDPSKRGGLVVLTDTWRVINSLREGDVMHSLHADGVEFVPTTVLCHGDVIVDGRPQYTMAHKSHAVMPEDRPILRRVHYRLVEDEVQPPPAHLFRDVGAVNKLTAVGIHLSTGT